MIKNKLLGAAALVAALAAPVAQAAPIVSLVSSAPSVTVGSTFTVSLRVEGVTDLYGWDADLSFGAPALVDLLGQATGGFFAGGDTFFAGDASVPGTISYVGAALSGLSGMSGDGFLAEFSFKALMEGVLSLDFDRIYMLDSVGNDIFVDTGDRFGTRISITAPGVVPVPGSLLLALLALGLLPAATRRSVKSA